jgi:hypothetical protein
MRLFFLALLLAASPAAAAADLQVGTWFGHGQPGDKAAMYIDRMNPDGSFRVHHRACRKGRAYDQVQTGRWSRKGNMMTIRIETVNGEPESRTDTYRIVSESQTAQRYVYLPENFEYNSRRVAPNYEMPRCDLVS